MLGRRGQDRSRSTRAEVQHLRLPLDFRFRSGHGLLADVKWSVKQDSASAAVAMAAGDPAVAYAHCAHVAKTRAGNFRYGMRLLPKDRRRAMYAIYACAREIDDIADGELEPAVKRGELDRMSRQLQKLHASGDSAGGHDDLLFSALTDAVSRYPIPLEEFQDLIAGVLMDVNEESYSTFRDLCRYCDRVAGSIGRLITALLSPADTAAAKRLGSSVWVGMQLTNILRDIAEDQAIGRIYLPDADLRQFGFSTGPDRPAFEPGAAFDALVSFEGERAASFYEALDMLLPMLDRRGAACIAAMAAIYRRLLTTILKEPSRVLDRRLTLPAREKVSIAARALCSRPEASWPAAASDQNWCGGE